MKLEKFKIILNEVDAKKSTKKIELLLCYAKFTKEREVIKWERKLLNYCKK